MERVSTYSPGPELADPQYADGLRMAVAGALDQAIAAIAFDEERTPPVPASVLQQARLAARSGVGVDTILRRYLAGYTLLGDLVVEENRGDALLRGVELQRVTQAAATVLERLIAAVTQEHRQETDAQSTSADQRLAERVRRLLAGDLVDTSPLGYEFDAWHIGARLSAADAGDDIRRLAAALDRQALVVSDGGEGAWAWLGGRRRIESAEVAERMERSLSAGLSVAIGEPAHGLGGWRLSHRQASAALPIALRRTDPVVRYAEVPLLASMLRDDLLVTSLRELYLAPLAEGRDGGGAARETLRAYFAADRNISSAAAAIGVNRRTVANRLQTIEAKLGCSLRTAAPRIEAALRLEELEPGSSRDGGLADRDT